MQQAHQVKAGIALHPVDAVLVCPRHGDGADRLTIMARRLGRPAVGPDSDRGATPVLPPTVLHGAALYSVTKREPCRMRIAHVDRRPGGLHDISP
jgi:hypothetical protein